VRKLAANPAPTGARVGNAVAGAEAGGVDNGGGVMDGTEAWAVMASCVDFLEEDGGAWEGAASVFESLSNRHWYPRPRPRPCPPSESWVPPPWPVESPGIVLVLGETAKKRFMAPQRSIV
jgi:hypothetical protein